MLKKIFRKIKRLRGSKSETFASFKPFLSAVCDEIKPLRVLEFGVGTSTAVIKEHSQAHIISIEESKEWYEEYLSKFSDKRVELYHKAAGWSLDELKEYGGEYDLIFVDGGDRLEELKYCVNLLAPNGVVYLHDAHREVYEAGVRAYPEIFFPERHSCVMCKSAEVMARLKKVVVEDYSCRCKYCGTDERRKYFAQFVEGQ
jgi:predicted O-methyltransferase YrrM